jgi:hypothetical protein
MTQEIPMLNKTKKKTSQTKSTAKPAARAAAIGAAAKRSQASRGAKRSTAASSGAAGGDAASRLPPIGTTLQKRDRYGTLRCECTITADGIRYDGQMYKSLSAAAMAAAGDLGLKNKTQNGFTFWGLTKPNRPGDPIEALERSWLRYKAHATSALAGAEGREAALRAIGSHAQALESLHSQGA